MYLHWRHHPYSRARGGVCECQAHWLTDRAMIDAAKAHLSFMVKRWGRSGAVFAWDLWNEMHPAHMGDDPAHFEAVTTELSQHVRDLELRLYGRAHPRTVSLFGPVLYSHPLVADTIFRHPLLGFASTHLYAHGTIDHPRDTVAPAVKMGELVAEALSHAPADRPHFDSEHGPIHSSKDKKTTLAEAFDDEYFRHMHWAHLASGGAGGGMRWPNRHPHVLTQEMRRAQAALAGFLPLIDWPAFGRRNLSAELRDLTSRAQGFACGDGRQAVVWLLRGDTLERPTGTLCPDAAPVTAAFDLQGLEDGTYTVTPWDIRVGRAGPAFRAECPAGIVSATMPRLITDLAFAIRPMN